MMKKKIPEEITNENFPNATKDKPRDSRISAPIEYTQRNNAQIIRWQKTKDRKKILKANQR